MTTQNATPPSPSADAPSSSSRPAADHRSEFVVAAGSFTTLVALYIVYALAHRGTYIMGWYANFIIPAGALLVGMTAASGYGFAAYATGLKMTPRLMWSVAGQLALSYFIAQYEEFRMVIRESSPISFWEWFDITTRAFSFSDRSGAPGSALGLLGYGVRALELAGFVGGGVMVPLILRARPYCDPCRTYRRSHLIAVLPAGAPERVFGKVPPEEDQAARETGLAGTQAIFNAALDGQRDELESQIGSHGPLSEKRAAHKRTGHINVHLVRCPRCADGWLSAQLVVGKGNNASYTPLGTAALEQDRVRALFD